MSETEKPNPLLVETIVNGGDTRAESKYKPEYAEQVYKYALLGLSDVEIAPLFDVHENTINNWKNEYPEFCDAIISGKDKADANVAKSLYDRAIGYEWKEEVVTKVKKSKDLEEVIITEVRKFIPPDVGAINSWLTNRKKKHWKNRNSVGGDEDAPPIQHEHTVKSLEGVSKEQIIAAIIAHKSVARDTSGT